MCLLASLHQVTTPKPVPRREGSQEETPLAIELRAVNKRYGSLVALDGVSFALWPGEIFGLLGPNGAGKTTIIRLLTTPADGRMPDSGRAIRQGACTKRIAFGGVWPKIVSRLLDMRGCEKR